MPNDFNKSEEGLKEYDKAGLEYDTNADDRHYEEFSSLVNNSIHKDKKTSEVTEINVHKTPEGGEFITYTQMERCQDNWGSPIRASRTRLGMYPIPVVQYGGRLDASGKPGRYVVGLIEIKTGYSMKRDSGAFRKLEGLGASSDKTKCYVKQGNRTRQLESYEDLKTGVSFDELMEYGKSAQRDFNDRKALRDAQRRLAEEEAKAIADTSKVVEEAKDPKEQEAAESTLREVGVPSSSDESEVEPKEPVMPKPLEKPTDNEGSSSSSKPVKRGK